MNEDTLQSKREFVEKMKRENPKAFAFLGKGATNLLLDLESDLFKELTDWVLRAGRICGIEKMKTMLKEVLKEIEKE